MATWNDHDFDDPMSEANRIDAMFEAVNSEPCPVCGQLPRPIPAGGARWVLEARHEPGCVVAQVDDAAPAAEADDGVWDVGPDGEPKRIG